MAIIQIGNFGNKEGVQTYRIHGDKEDLERIIDESIKIGHEFHSEPTLEYVRKGCWTILLQLKVPVGVGANGE